MKINDVRVGARYIARVSRIMTTVRVIGLRIIDGRRGPIIDAINERTGRRIAIRSARRLRAEMKGEPNEQEQAT